MYTRGIDFGYFALKYPKKYLLLFLLIMIDIRMKHFWVVDFS